ncbi:MAG: hypothetical protein AB7D57_02230 [Desulfovibrionaceae bacterium]
MKIYTRVVLDMRTGEVLHEESHEYGGPVALCKGGSGGTSTTNTVDYEYNRRMATIAEAQNNMAQEYFDFWKSDYKPLEQAQIAANLDLIEKGTPVRDAFIEQSLNGVDEATVAGLAQTDAQAAASGAQQATQRSLARMGINPTSGAYQEAMQDTGLNTARTVAAAKNNARVVARDENYERLKAAMGLGLSTSS